MAEVKDKLVTVESAKAIHDSLDGKISTHTSNKSNPHGVTLAQLGVTASANEVNFVDGVTSNIQAQLDALSSGKAPAGYGYGEIPTMFYFNDDMDGSLLENALNVQLNRMANGETKQIRFSDNPYISGTTYIATLWKHTADYAVLYGNDYYSGGLRKIKYNGQWYPHEWENPIMLLDKEYRTTERWMGKVVYTKAINFGNMPNSSFKTVSHNADATLILRVAGHADTGGGTTIPCHMNEFHSELDASASIIRVTNNFDQSNTILHVQIWYIKD